MSEGFLLGLALSGAYVYGVFVGVITAKDLKKLWKAARGKR